MTVPVFSADYLSACNHELIYFISHEHPNIIPALSEGLVTTKELDALCVERRDILQSLEHLFSDESIALMRKGLFSLEDTRFLKSHSEILQYILKLTADAAVRETQAFETASPVAPDLAHQLRKAAATGDLSTCEALLRSSPLVIDAPGPGSGKTALHWASEKGHENIVYFLLQQGVSLLKDKHEKTAYDLTTVPEIHRALQYHFKDYFLHNAVKYNIDLTESDATAYGFGNFQYSCRVRRRKFSLLAE